MENLHLTDADRDLGVYLVGIIKGYFEGYDFAKFEEKKSDPAPGREDSVDDPSSRARSAAPLRGESPPSSTTNPDPDAGVKDKNKDVVRGMVHAAHALALIFERAGLAEAELIAQRYATTAEWELR